MLYKSYTKTINLKYQHIPLAVKKFPGGSYYLLDIQDHFEYIFKKHETLTDNPPIRLYVSKIGNRITFKIKTGYYLQLLIPNTMKLLGSTKSSITENENGLFHLEN